VADQSWDRPVLGGEWAPDPWGQAELRWHDGQQWTGHVANSGAVSPPTTPPVTFTPPASPPTPIMQAPAGNDSAWARFRRRPIAVQIVAWVGLGLVALIALGLVLPKPKDKESSSTAANESIAATTTQATTTTVALTPDEQAIADGKVAMCHDGGYSDNTDFSATCSGGGGIARWLGTYGQCADGSFIVLSTDASCHDGFTKVMPADFAPTARSTDIAKCHNGLYSNNADLTATCSSNGGVAEWLAAYGQCVDGTIIKMSATDACSGHDGFGTLKEAGFVPTAGPNDIAQCSDGTFSDNHDLSGTCNSRGGVATWLAQYGRCPNGTVVLLGTDTCGADKLQELLPGYVPETTTTIATTIPAPPAFDPNDPATLDLTFTVLMQSEGIDPVAAKSAALSFCQAIDDNGGDVRLTLIQAAVLATQQNIDPSLVGKIMGAGVSAYCPQYKAAMAAAAG